MFLLRVIKAATLPLFIRIRCRCMLWHVIHSESDSEFGNNPAGTADRVLSTLCVVCKCLLSCSLSPSACILFSPAKVNRHRFGALGAARLTHYSKCQVCKWSALSLSSHITWVIALWQSYLFWCSIHTSIAFAAMSLEMSLLSGYGIMLSMHLWHLNKCITQKLDDVVSF